MPKLLFHPSHHPNSESDVPNGDSWLETRFGDRAGIVLDRHGFIVAANSQAAQLLGRTPAELESTPFGLPTPVSRRMELDLILPGGRRCRAVADVLPREEGDDYDYVRLEKVVLQHQSFRDVVAAAISAAGALRQVRVELPDLNRVRALVRTETSEILADWLVFLADLAGGNNVSIAMDCVQHRKMIELRLSLDLSGAEPCEQPVLPFPDDTAGLLEDMGGSFRVVAEGPVTTVHLEVPRRAGAPARTGAKKPRAASKRQPKPLFRTAHSGA